MFVCWQVNFLLSITRGSYFDNRGQFIETIGINVTFDNKPYLWWISTTMRNSQTWIIYATSLTMLVQVWSANFWSCKAKYSQILSDSLRISSSWSFEDKCRFRKPGDKDFTLKQDRIMKIINRSSFLQHIIVEPLKRLIATRLSPLYRRKFFCI